MIDLIVLDLDDTGAETTRDLQGRHERLPYLQLVDGARDFFEVYRKKLVLLTMGNRLEQETKLEMLGVRPYFRRMQCVESELEKGLALRELVKNCGLDPFSVVVVGDRLDLEIWWGNLLGCHTVRVRLRGGKYASCEPDPYDRYTLPEYTVSNFHELGTLPLFVQNRPVAG